MENTTQYNRLELLLNMTEDYVNFQPQKKNGLYFYKNNEMFVLLDLVN